MKLGIIICSNDDHDLFYSYDKCNLGFSNGKVKIMDFSETIAFCDLKAGRWMQTTN